MISSQLWTAADPALLEVTQLKFMEVADRAAYKLKGTFYARHFSVEKVNIIAGS